jgi:putative ABC transport system permease protein
MRLNDIAKLSTRMFKTNPSRTWMTIMGMGVGTGAVVTLVGLGFGLQGIILEQIVLGDTLLSLNVGNPGTQKVMLNPQTTAGFMQIPNVKDVASMASYQSQITFRGLTGGAFLQGAPPAYFKYTGIKMVEGEGFKDGNEAADRNGVILNKAVLKLFEVATTSDAIGEKVTFRVVIPIAGSDETEEVVINKEYRIIGVTSEENYIAAFVTMDEFAAQLPITSYERTQVRVTDAAFLDVVQEEIVKQGFVVTALSKTVDQANKIFQGIQVVLAVFGGIALVVSAIGMFNTMTVTLLERTAEIGIMRTLGASSNDIKILFISEAVIVGFLGGMVGIGIGVGIGFGLNTMVNVAAANFGGKAMKLFAYPPIFLIFIATFSAVVGFLTGVFPARRAARLDPLDAIRYK